MPKTKKTETILSPIVKIKRVLSEYELPNGKQTISAEVTDRGICLKNQYADEEFVFFRSKPEMVKAIGELIVASAKLKV